VVRSDLERVNANDRIRIHPIVFDRVLIDGLENPFRQVRHGRLLLADRGNQFCSLLVVDARGTVPVRCNYRFQCCVVSPL